MALDEGSSLDLDPTRRLPLPLETPIRLLALPAWLSKRTTGLLRVEGVRPQQAPLDLTTSHEKQQFTRFYRLLQGGLCMGSAWADWNFVFTGSNTPLNDSNFFTARDLWFSDQAAATATYGHIKDWNVTGVTNMAKPSRTRPPSMRI